MPKEHDTGIKIVTQNRKARHDFAISEACAAGMALLGTEVNSLRSGVCSIEEAFGRPKGSEVFLYDMHIPPYAQATIHNHEPRRPRNLLLRHCEIPGSSP